MLFFYPLDWTFVCPTEIIAFSDKAKAFRAIGAEVLGCSVDSKFSHFNWINQSRKEGGLGGLDIPLIAGNSKSLLTFKDITKQISGDYGVLIEEGGDAGLAARYLLKLMI